jgi:hypothetical protein
VELVRFVRDVTVPASARFAVARLHEALSRPTPLLLSAVGHNDPRELAHDLTAAIDWMNTAPPPRKQPWAVLVPRLRRVVSLIRHDQAMRRWFSAEVNAVEVAYALLPSNPNPPDWPPVGPIMTPAAAALRDAMLHPTAGYRPRLIATIAVAFTGTIAAPPAWRRLDERLGLLAAMLLDEGRGADELLVELVAALRQAPPQRWPGVVRVALSGGWDEFQVIAAAAGVGPKRWHPDAVPDALPVSLRTAGDLLRQGWPARIMLSFIIKARIAGADGLVLTRTRARDETHAVRLGRGLAARAADHQATTAPYERARILSPTLVRRRDSVTARLTDGPSREVGPAPRRHPAVSAAGAMSYLRRAALSESDVERVLWGWIGIESLGRGRGGLAPAKLVSNELPELAWLLGARATFLHSYSLLEAAAGNGAGWRIVLGHLRPNSGDWDERWLDLLAGVGPPQVQIALDQAIAQSDPLVAWRVKEGRERLLNGRLFVQVLGRHRTEVAWAIARVRESRNTIAHNALVDVEQMSVGKSLGQAHQRPVDARFLGRVAMVTLAEVGAVAASRLTGAPGQLPSFEAFLNRTSISVSRIERRAKRSGRGARFQSRVPPLP